MGNTEGRKIQIKLVIFLMIGLAVPLAAWATKESPWQKKLPFAEATIHYALSGIETGSETLYIRDYGRETAKYHKTTMNMMGMLKASETITFTDPDWIYTYDLIKKTGTREVNPKKYLIEEFTALNQDEKDLVVRNSEKLGLTMTGGMSGDYTRNAANLIGFDCDRMRFMGSTVYTMHDTGIALKTESKMMGVTILIEATEVIQDPVDEDSFKHPQNITAEMDPEADTIARALAKQTITMLKDPKAVQKAEKNKPLARDADQEMTPEEQQELEEAMEALKGIFGK